MVRTATAGLVLAISAGMAQAQDRDAIARGEALVTRNCGRCHAVGASGESPQPPAPPFRFLGRRYPVESLEEALAEGTISSHPEMPDFTFDPDEVGAIIAYLKSVQVP